MSRNTTSLPAAETTEPIAAFPMAREPRCPFDPPPTGSAAQEAGPLTRVELSDGSTPWFVTRYAEQRTLLSDPRISADVKRPGYPIPANSGSTSSPFSFILMDDPEHARLRRMVTAPFMVKRVEAMRPRVQQIVDQLIEDMLATDGPVDLVQAFALPMPSLVICELLGVPYADHNFFQRNSNALINREASPEQRRQAVEELVGYLHGLLEAKKNQPADDIFSDLAQRTQKNELSSHDAAMMGVLLLVAGHETTANMIALGALALLEHPDQLKRLQEQEDSKLVVSAVEELLRYLTITHDGRKRVAVEEIDISGHTIRAGDGVIMATDLGNRDPEAFPDPDNLDLGRDARHHVAFGFGVHQCLGQPLARMELQVAYSTLFRRIPTLRLATTLDKVPFKHDGSVYGVYELPVTW
ncbi:cytochrome P450 [Arthrobacter sp. Rue61a]|uniref:cytochrome P450 n=1 Tax=Arthrobacter sp. Rue61a TaxID=1118963 RepID=UPI00027DFD28|nr:cytochrome P450 [Arthrobacter sp. Rue61a]AFR28737.1 putative cytochrome P450 (CYP) oxygenase [Arthrobacter sp. Rue61a]